MIVSGRIVEEQKNYYIIDTEAGRIRSTLKGIAKKKFQRLFAGDFVDIEIIDKDTNEGIIKKVISAKKQIIKTCTYKY
jgi:putative ribosome biogenesis GTPase RsgA